MLIYLEGKVNIVTMRSAKMRVISAEQNGSNGLVIAINPGDELMHKNTPVYLVRQLAMKREGDRFPQVTLPGDTLETINWKPSLYVVVLGDSGKAKLAEIEALLPGFTAMLEPSETVVL